MFNVLYKYSNDEHKSSLKTESIDIGMLKSLPYVLNLVNSSSLLLAFFNIPIIGNSFLLLSDLEDISRLLHTEDVNVLSRTLLIFGDLFSSAYRTQPLSSLTKQNTAEEHIPKKKLRSNYKYIYYVPSKIRNFLFTNIPL